MIRAGAVAHVLGLFLLLLAVAMLPPLGVALAAGDDPTPLAFGWLATAAAGLVLYALGSRPQGDVTLREAMLLVLLVWLLASVFGALPLFFSPYFRSFTDAFFEAASGFTTTGATVLAEVEPLPRGLQFWRIFMHWLGGMGIVLLMIAVLPLLGAGGMHLYRAEFSGAKSDKLKPRIAETALSLWRIYFALTLALYVALRWAGLDAFEAACHAFSTLGTGGFSTRTASVGGFSDPRVEYIIVVFMFLAGINFARQYQFWVERRKEAFFGDVEVRAYCAVIVGASLIVFASLVGQSGYGLEPALRAALFQVTSIATTTGFATADYEAWGPLPQLVLLMLMFSGGCTGSSAGGLKVARLVLLLKVVDREFRSLVERRAVFAVRLGGQVVPEAAIRSLLNLVYLAFLVNFASCLLLAAAGVDVLTAISAVAACMFNIGPALGSVGPAENYGHLPDLAKWVLSGCMIAGRLEFYTALVALSPAFWRR
ncbi:MAG: TrkH family potassium uptake protein [Bryobacterales bacterium]|nr:TrkH family potassium uptake protein [Bryobacteraceae bacterium]MDW8353137.1 TrkH family potassium uptake protein [Bryobacterales bacterium]